MVPWRWMQKLVEWLYSMELLLVHCTFLTLDQWIKQLFSSREHILLVLPLRGWWMQLARGILHMGCESFEMDIWQRSREIEEWNFIEQAWIQTTEQYPLPRNCCNLSLLEKYRTYKLFDQTVGVQNSGIYVKKQPNMYSSFQSNDCGTDRDRNRNLVESENPSGKDAHRHAVGLRPSALPVFSCRSLCLHCWWVMASATAPAES